jgi:hypothetical protein
MFDWILCDMYKKNYLSVKLGSKLTQPFKSDVGGAYHQGRSSGASILYKTIMYNKFIAYSL